MLLNILKIPVIVLEVLIIFNLMIIVHELGHFLAARWRKMHIEKFGIWFGKPIWKKTINGVEYSFGTIPMGGFVALPQMAPMEVLEGQSQTPREQLPPVSALDKIIVAFAGPLFSFLLAFAFATIVWAVGRPVTEGEATTTIGYVEPGSPAAAVGLKAGDVITSIDGEPVTHFSGMGSDTVTWRIIRNEGDTVVVTVERNVGGVMKTLTFSPQPHIEPTKWWMRKALPEIGIAAAQRPMVAKVLPGSPAAKAGLQESDLITSINGEPAYSLESVADYVKNHPAPSYTLGVERDGKIIQLPFTPLGATVDEVVSDGPADTAGVRSGDEIVAVDGKSMPDGVAISDYVQKHNGKPVVFTIKRDGKTQDTTITPEFPVGETTPRIGLVWQDEFGIVEDAFGKFQVLHPSPFDQVKSGMMTIVDTIGAIAAPKSNVGIQHMGGPLMMMRVYYMFFESREGWRLALWFSVVINVNLAMINLLPIPVLDGGHITLAIVEAIRRRPINLRLLEMLQASCFVVVIGFMLYIAFFDAQDFYGAKGDQMRFEPKAATPATSAQSQP
jgi:regulator of sigma E protease